VAQLRISSAGRPPEKIPYVHRLVIRRGKWETKGYQVRKNSENVSQFFSDKLHGGALAALRKALQYARKNIKGYPC
jgi:hypothetical protein